MFALSMLWLVFHYGWSSPLLQIPHSLYSGENLCGKQKFTKICTKREFIDCHIIPFPAIVPHFNTGLQKKLLRQFSWRSKARFCGCEERRGTGEALPGPPEHQHGLDKAARSNQSSSGVFPA